MARNIGISKDRLVYNTWTKIVDFDIRLSSRSQIETFTFEKDDIIFLDLDDFDEELDFAINSNIIAFSSNLDELTGFKLLKKGIKAYIKTSISLVELQEVIKTVKLGKVWVYPELMSFIIKNSTISSFANSQKSLDKLTKKEFEVAKLVSQGFTNNDIAQELDITLRTVKAHISSCFSKLELKDRVSLAMLVKENTKN